MRGKQIHSKAGIFRSENIVLSTVTSIHNIRKSTKYRNSETRWKADMRRCAGLKCQTGQKKEKSSW